MNWQLFFDRLDALRDARGLSDTSLSLNAGLSRDGIRNWKRAHRDGREPGATTSSLAKLSEYLDVPTAYLTGEVDMISGFDESGSGFTPGPLNTQARRILEKLDAPGEPTLPSVNQIQIGMDGRRVQIIATLDREGIEQLRRKLDHLAALLE